MSEAEDARDRLAAAWPPRPAVRMITLTSYGGINILTTPKDASDLADRLAANVGQEWAIRYPDGEIGYVSEDREATERRRLAHLNPDQKRIVTRRVTAWVDADEVTP